METTAFQKQTSSASKEDSGMVAHVSIKLKESVQVDMNITLVFVLRLLHLHAHMVTISLEAHALLSLLFLAPMEEFGMVRIVLFQLRELAQPITISTEHNVH
jgi:hypothetical protein